LRSETGQPRTFTDILGVFLKKKFKGLLKDWMAVTREMVRGFRGFGWMDGWWCRGKELGKGRSGAGFGWLARF